MKQVAHCKAQIWLVEEDSANQIYFFQEVISMTRFTPYFAFYLRLALGISFLSAVADRFGLWGPPSEPQVAWGNFPQFLAYTAQLNPYLPPAWIPALGWTVTAAEMIFGIFLIVGLWIRRTALLSGILLGGFAIGMLMGLNLKAPLDYSVLTASAGALLLSQIKDHVWCADHRFLTREKT